MRHHEAPRTKKIYQRKLTHMTDDNSAMKDDKKSVTADDDHPAKVEEVEGSSLLKRLAEKQKELDTERKKQTEEFEKQKKELEEERKRQEAELDKERRELKEQKQVRHREDEESKHKDDKVVFKSHEGDWMETCKREARDQMEKVGRSQEAMLQLIEDLTECVEEPVSDKLIALNQEISFQTNTRLQVGDLLENYTCADDNAPMSEDVSSHQWLQGDGRERTVHIKHDRPASRIHVVSNFIDEEECKAMEDAAAKYLHHASVANGKGGSRISDNRKAMQAGIKVPWHKEADGHPIARLSRRVYDYTNHVLDLNIDEHGQEDLMSIQYSGRGLDDEHPDRYMPHCDGGCTGLPFHNGTRMATMVMYCTLPTHGGATNFRNAGIHVKPEKGSAVFFSYMDPKTLVTDDRFTEHSGCPVYEGDKKIVTQWIRLGVDKENPWTSFNTLGIKMSDAKEYE